MLTTLVFFALTKSTASLDRTVIEKTIESHFEEVTSCYQSGLERNGELAGTVTVRLAISEKGEVANASVQETTLKDAPVEECIVAAVKKWKFPKPKGRGIVFANYPFVLRTK